MKNKVLILLLIFSLLSVMFYGCKGNEKVSEDITNMSETETTVVSTTKPWSWESATPDSQGVSSEEIDNLHNTFESFNLLSSVIVKNDKIIDEYYKDGYDKDSLFLLNSASKSVTSALVGIAIDKGFIQDTDVLLSEYFPEVKSFSDDNWDKITIEHLLTHTSGIRSTDSDLWYDWRNSDNWLEYIFSLPFDSAPGTQFSYSTGNTHLLSAIIEKATNMSLYDFGKKYLFGPVGMDSVKIDTSPEGVSDGGNGIYMNVYDMAKFGRLYLENGKWEGNEIISEEWINHSTSVQFKRSDGSADYGYQWWVRTFGGENYDAFFAQGHGGQYIFVVPDLDLIVVFSSDYEGATGIYWQMVENIVNAC